MTISLFVFLFTGFHVSMKMKRAAVALCANDSGDHRRRGKSVKKGKFIMLAGILLPSITSPPSHNPE